jgi:PIN domain nuclease of toxin-antitoxin system
MLDVDGRAFILDTHILLWAFYSRCAITKSYQKAVYPEFIKHLIPKNCKLIVSTLNINEMLHFIEKNECDIYNNLHGKNLSVKRFRQLDEQRAFVQAEIQLILKQISNIKNFTIIPMTIDIAIIDSFVQNLSNHNCDFFDYFLLDYCNKNGLALITDDSDYTKNNLIDTDIYTANPNILKISNELK